MVEVKDNGDLLQKVPYAHCCTECPQPCSRPRVSPTHTSAGDSWTLTGKSGSVSCGVTARFSWVLACTRFCLCPPRVCFPSPVLSSGSSMVGLMATSSKRSYSIPRSPAPRAAASAAVHCRLMPCRRHSNIVLSQSLWGFWVLVYPRFV